jgi:hypothetical protein
MQLLNENLHYVDKDFYEDTIFYHGLENHGHGAAVPLNQTRSTLKSKNFIIGAYFMIVMQGLAGIVVVIRIKHIFFHQ